MDIFFIVKSILTVILLCITVVCTVILKIKYNTNPFKINSTSKQHLSDEEMQKAIQEYNEMIDSDNTMNDEHIDKDLITLLKK